MDKILVVDLCDTLYKSNTTQDFFEYVFMNDYNYKLIKRKKSSFRFKVINKLSNKFFKYDMSRVILTKILNGKSCEEIGMLVKKFIENDLNNKVIKQTHKLIGTYKKEGFKIIIVSASYGFIVKEIVRKLNIDGWISSEAEFIDNKFTGKVKSDILHTKFLRFSEKFKDYDELVMITDNETDYEFVRKTKKAYIVINDKNRNFWLKRKEEKFILLEGENDD